MYYSVVYLRVKAECFPIFESQGSCFRKVMWVLHKFVYAADTPLLLNTSNSENTIPLLQQIAKLQGYIERCGISKIPKITTYHNYTQYRLYYTSSRKNKVAFMSTKGRLKKENNVWLEQGPVLIFNFIVIQYINTCISNVSCRLQITRGNITSV